MGRECIICGRGLRSGRKYCYSCRGLSKEGYYSEYKKSKPLSKKQKFIVCGILLFAFGLYMFNTLRNYSIPMLIIGAILFLIGIFFIKKKEVLNISETPKT